MIIFRHFWLLLRRSQTRNLNKTCSTNELSTEKHKIVVLVRNESDLWFEINVGIIFLNLETGKKHKIFRFHLSA